jgi:hypothetical protein
VTLSEVREPVFRFGGSGVIQRSSANLPKMG